MHTLNLSRPLITTAAAFITAATQLQLLACTLSLNQWHVIERALLSSYLNVTAVAAAAAAAAAATFIGATQLHLHPHTLNINNDTG